MNKVIAIVGMSGCGKTIACEYFEKKGYSKIYFGGITIEELKKQGLKENEANERKVREGFRKDYGMAAFAILNLPKIEEALKKGNALIDGLYSWAEYKVLKEKYPDEAEESRTRYGIKSANGKGLQEAENSGAKNVILVHGLDEPGRIWMNLILKQLVQLSRKVIRSRGNSDKQYLGIFDV